jgi:hypothetical protein
MGIAGPFTQKTNRAGGALIRIVKPARGPMLFLAFSCPIQVSVQR